MDASLMAFTLLATATYTFLTKRHKTVPFVLRGIQSPWCGYMPYIHETLLAMPDEAFVMYPVENERMLSNVDQYGRPYKLITWTGTMEASAVTPELIQTAQGMLDWGGPRMEFLIGNQLVESTLATDDTRRAIRTGDF